MLTVPRVLTVIGAAALLITASATPTVAVDVPPPDPPDARITVVQGVPGAVDICVGGREIRSGVKFGKWATTTVSPRVYRIRVFRPDDRNCAGKKIIDRKVNLFPNRDVTLILKLGKPRVRLFDNNLIGPAGELPEPEWVPVAVRHAARAYKIEMTVGIGVDVPPVGPVVPPVGTSGTASVFGEPWSSGDQIATMAPDLLDVFVVAHRGTPPLQIVQAKMVDLKPGRSHEIYLVGWNRETYRWVVIRRPWNVVY